LSDIFCIEKLKDGAKINFSEYLEKLDPGSGIFFAMSHLLSKKELIDKISRIGKAVLEEIGYIHIT